MSQQMDFNQFIAHMKRMDELGQGHVVDDMVREAEAVLAAEGMHWIPNQGPQWRAYYSEADQTLYGGQAGGGKTDLLIGLATQRHRRSLLVRRQNNEIDDLTERAISIVGHDEGFRRAPQARWNMPDGRLIMFGGMQFPGDEKKYKGQAKDFIGVDEATEFLESQIDYISQWLRTKDKNPDGTPQRVRLVLATNPPTTPEGEWVITWFAPWIDPEHELYGTVEDGELLYFCRNPDDTFRWEREPFQVGTDGNGRPIMSMSRTFIRSTLADNPDLAESGQYAAQLASKPEALRARYERGEFISDPDDDEFQIIPTLWVMEAQERWKQRFGSQDAIVRHGLEMTAIGVDIAQGGCFDDQTEILTDRGWKFFENLNGTEKVLTLRGDVAEWGDIVQLHRYRHVGPMNLWHRRGLSFCITDNHQLVAGGTGRRRADWKVRRYDHLPEFFTLRRSNAWGGGGNPPTVSFASTYNMPNGGVRRKDWTFDYGDWAEFLGWFVSEGSAFKERRTHGRWRINISQNRGAKFDRIAALLQRMGIVARRPKSRSGLEFSINEIGAHLAEHCGVHADNKRIPRYLLEAGPEAMERFLESYRLGDGSRNNVGVSTYTTTSKGLADDLHEMLAKLGRAGRISVAHKAGSTFRIGNRNVVRKRDVFTVNDRLSSDSDICKSKVERVHYDGMVYCVTTPLKTICVRRAGTVMWSGNSDKTVLAPRYGEVFGELLSFPGEQTPDGPTAAALILKHLRDSAQINIDLGGGWGGSCYDFLKENDLVSLYGFVPNGESHGKTQDGKMGFTNRRTEALWMLREALDPTSIFKICLPPDKELRADLCATRYKLAAKAKYQAEPKDAIKERIGRSPDRGDAVMISWFTGTARQRAGRVHNVSRRIHNLPTMTNADRRNDGRRMIGRGRGQPQQGFVPPMGGGEMG